MNTLRLALIAGSALLALGGIASANPGWQSLNSADPYTYTQAMAPEAMPAARADSCLVTEPTFSTMNQHVNGSRTVNICK